MFHKNFLSQSMSLSLLLIDHFFIHCYNIINIKVNDYLQR